MNAASIEREVRRAGNPRQAALLQRFFKTGPGEYAEGDRFVGLMVPDTRQLARAHRDLPLSTVKTLLRSGLHEVRLLALLILVDRYGRGSAAERAAIYRLYCSMADRINNWDLVDLSAPRIIGPHLENRSRRPLYRWIHSPNLWQRRIAVLATFHFINRGDFRDALALAHDRLADPHDLMHKAVGWMLREIGKRDERSLTHFLDRHYPRMPRTMLRYSLERLAPARRRHYMKRKA